MSFKIAVPQGMGLKCERLLKHPERFFAHRNLASLMMLTSLSLMFQH